VDARAACIYGLGKGTALPKELIPEQEFLGWIGIRLSPINPHKAETGVSGRGFFQRHSWFFFGLQKFVHINIKKRKPEYPKHLFSNFHIFFYQSR